jgi:hypothetical protein
MPLKLVMPNSSDQVLISDREGRPFWSGGTAYWLRKWGLLHIENGSPMHDEQCFLIAGRGYDASKIIPGFYEGPFSKKFLEQCEITSVDCSTSELELRLVDEPVIIGPGLITVEKFGRPVDTVRKIPTSGKINSKPYQLEPTIDNKKPYLSYQRFNHTSNWKVLAYARAANSNEYYPAILSNGSIILSGLPVLDLAVEKMVMPACPVAYYAPVRQSLSWRVEAWLIEKIVLHAIAADQVLVRVRPWPSGYSSALTVRHDYDRQVKAQTLDDLLDFYNCNGIKASFGFLTQLIPGEQVKRVKSQGHEIVLHSVAADETLFNQEISELSNQAEVKIKGATCHGGTGSAGHLGETLFRWCANVGLSYTEQLGRDHILPHPALTWQNGSVQQIGAMIMSSHHSLDSGTAPHAHSLDFILTDLQTRLAAGGLINLMNHPDIHQHQLRRLLENIELKHVWCATHHEVTEWCRITKYDSTWSYQDNCLILSFPEQLPFDFAIEIVSKAGSRQLILPDGDYKYKIPIPSFNDKSAFQSIFNPIHSFGFELEKKSIQFRKSNVK